MATPRRKLLQLWHGWTWKIDRSRLSCLSINSQPLSISFRSTLDLSRPIVLTDSTVPANSIQGLHTTRDRRYRMVACRGRHAGRPSRVKAMKRFGHRPADRRPNPRTPRILARGASLGSCFWSLCGPRIQGGWPKIIDSFVK